MMAWTDRHCRYLLRLCAPDVRLFTEMVTSGALIYGPRERLLRFDPSEHPLAIQLGGSDPAELAQAARMAQSAGFDEINLNVGCPSARVQRGRFGACLMKEPDLVAELIDSMRQVVDIDVSVKCRLGVDDADSQPLLETFVGQIAETGCRRFYLHARKAVLGGLSPAQNRQIPPLQPQRVYALKQSFPDLEIHINGGICEVDTAAVHLDHVDGIMIGREAYHRPLFLCELAQTFLQRPGPDVWAVMDQYLAYIERETAAGTRLHDMTRHCLGIFSGFRGARRFRQLLSDASRLRSNDPGLVAEAVAGVAQQAA
jgi:tRNA-dihydrouridine synthase A